MSTCVWSLPPTPWLCRAAVWIAAIALTVVPTAVAQTQTFANQGFEDGLVDWSQVSTVVTDGTQRVSVSCGSTGSLNWDVSPYAGGSKMARLQPTNVIRGTTGAWDQLGLSEASRHYLNSIFPNSTDYAIVYRDLTLQAGERFTMAWNYVATDYAPFNDGSFVSLVNTNDASAPLPLINGLVGDLQVLGVTVANNTGTYVTGDCGSTGWQTTTFEVRTSATYRLGFAAFNLSDTAYSPVLFVDEAAGGTLRNGLPFAPIPPSATPPPPQVEPDAVVSTGAVSAASASSAQVAGTLSSVGTGPLTQHGHVWSTTTNPSVNLTTKTELGSLTGPSSFTSTLTGLEAATTYYVRSYATNANGTSYGSVVTFATSSACEMATAPVSITVTSVGTTTAELAWAESTGTSPVTYSWSVRRTSDDTVVAAGTTSAMTTSVAGLTPGETYQAQVYAENCGGATAVVTSAAFTTQKLSQSQVSGSLDAHTVHYGDETIVRASGGSGGGAFEFRQHGGTGAVAFSGDSATRSVRGLAVGTAVIEVRRLGDATYLDGDWVGAGTLTIEPRPVTITADDVWKTYAEPAAADPELTWSLSGGSFVAGDAVTGALARTPGESVGTYGVSQGTLSAGPNYDLTFVTGTLTIRHGPAHTLVVAVPASPLTAAVPFDVVSIVAVDQFGNLADGANGATAFTGTIDLTVTGANVALWPPERRTATASAGVATVPCVWIDAPARNVRFLATADGLESGESDPFDVTGVNLVGSIYEDPDGSGSRPAAAVGIEGASVRLLGAGDTTVAWPNGASFDGTSCMALTTASVLSAADGSFTLRGLDAGSVELVVAGEILERYVRVERGPLRLDLPSFGTVAGVDVGYFPGAFVEGAVFRDDGAGALAVANDGVRSGAEPGRSGVNVTALFDQRVLPTRSAADGSYRLAVPLTDPAEIAVSHDASRATGHTLTAAGEVSTILAAGSTGDVASFSASPGAIYELDFGVVPSLRISGGGESVTTSPGSARFVLNLEPGTPSTVRLSASAGSYAWTARIDPSDETCAAALTALLEPDSGAWRLDGSWPRAANGSLRSCPVEVEVQVPSGEPAGRVHDLLVRASATWQRPAEAPAVVDTSAAQQLRTSVVEGGRVALRFDASVDGGVSYAARVEAAPGTPVRYRVRFDNPSAQLVHDVVVRVPIDAAYRRPAEAALAATLVCPGGSEAASISLPYDTALAIATLNLEQFCGLQALAPGAAGVLSFEVEVR